MHRPRMRALQSETAPKASAASPMNARRRESSPLSRIDRAMKAGTSAKPAPAAAASRHGFGDGRRSLPVTGTGTHRSPRHSVHPRGRNARRRECTASRRDRSGSAAPRARSPPQGRRRRSFLPSSGRGRPAANLRRDRRGSPCRPPLRPDPASVGKDDFGAEFRMCREDPRRDRTENRLPQQHPVRNPHHAFDRDRGATRLPTGLALSFSGAIRGRREHLIRRAGQCPSTAPARAPTNRCPSLR